MKSRTRSERIVSSFCPSMHEREEFLATLVDQITLADPHFTFGVDLRLVANEHSIASSSLGVSKSPDPLPVGNRESQGVVRITEVLAMKLVQSVVSFLCNAPFSRTWLFSRSRPNRCDSTRPRRFLHFPITSLVSVLYFGERPEIAPHDEESKKAKTSKTK